MKHGDIMKQTVIRPVALSDIGDILNIYGWYIQNTAITFEVLMFSCFVVFHKDKNFVSVLSKNIIFAQMCHLWRVGKKIRIIK